MNSDAEIQLRILERISCYQMDLIVCICFRAYSFFDLSR